MIILLSYNKLMKNIIITQETVAHKEQRDALISACFSKPQPERAAYRLRQGIAPVSKYSYVVLHNHCVVGSVRFTPMLLPDNAEVLMLGPLAVDPLLRGQHIGQSLVQYSLQKLQKDAYAGIIVIGDAGYFTALGFDVALTQNLTLPGVVAPLTLLGLEWQAGFLSQQSGMIQPLKAKER